MKNLKDYIFEGSWGYEPQDGDSPLDYRGNLMGKLTETIYDECFKRIHSNDEGIRIDADSAWDVVAAIEFFFEKFCLLDDIYKDSDNEYEKYYYWWRLKELHQKDIIDLYTDAISRCANDKNWINDWKEPDKMKKSLKKRADILKKYAKLRDDYFQSKLKNEKDRATATAQQVKNPDKKSVACGKEGWIAIEKTEDITED